MQLIRHTALLLGLVAAAPVLGQPQTTGAAETPATGVAAEVDQTHEEPQYTFGMKAIVYVQQDDDAQTEVSQDATVYETLILFQAKPTPRDTITVSTLIDVVTAASNARQDNAGLRSITGGQGITHIGGQAAYNRDFGGWGLGVQGSYAYEYAYQSIGAGANGFVSFFEGATTLSFGVSGFFDNVAMLRFDDQDQNDRPRTSLTGTVDWTQTLTRDARMILSYQHTEQFGYLGTQTNWVYVRDDQAYEVLPERRSRDSATLRFKHAVRTHDAVEVGVRYYHDDWGVDSVTADSRYFWSFAEQWLLLELGYRYYYQTGANAFGLEFLPSQTFRTSDTDLQGFMGHMASARLELTPRGVGNWGVWDVGGNYYFRDNGLHMFWFELGYRATF